MMDSRLVRILTVVVVLGAGMMAAAAQNQREDATREPVASQMERPRRGSPAQHSDPDAPSSTSSSAEYDSSDSSFFPPPDPDSSYDVLPSSQPNVEPQPLD